MLEGIQRVGTFAKEFQRIDDCVVGNNIIMAANACTLLRNKLSESMELLKPNNIFEVLLAE
jgi:hypothetical protein